MLESKMKWLMVNEGEDKNKVEWDSPRYSPLMKELLMMRGVTTDTHAEKFLAPDLMDIEDPDKLSHINQAASRVYESIESNEKILVYGDYDADGVCSTAIMIEALQQLGANCHYYIPNRFTEGYGPNEEAFREAYANGYGLIITVDTGIAAVHEAEVAKELGLDLIITDHHEPQNELPDAYAILHPKCSPDYDFKELAGAGVAFRFAEKLLNHLPEQFLDLLAIGTIADMVPLVNENRIFAYHGLKALSATDRAGLIALKKICDIQSDVDEEDVGFSIAPRINAVGRLQDAALAVQLVLSENQEEADKLAEDIQSLNQKRQKIVNEIVKEADELVEPVNEQGVIVVAKQGWNEGVLGIVAANLVRKYDRPAIVFSVFPEKGIMKGSARSIPAFDMFTNCMRIRDVFTHFGGHSQAAGMTIPIDNFDILKTKLHQIIHQELKEEDFTQEIEIAKSITLQEINQELVEEVKHLAPFGIDNPKPVFHIKALTGHKRQVGHKKNHLKLQFRNGQRTLDGIGFSLGDLYDFLTPGTEVSAVGELGINEWNGVRKVQMIVKDMAISERQVFDHRGERYSDIRPFLNRHLKQIALYKTRENISESLYNSHHVFTFTYDEAIYDLNPVHTLFLCDLPPSLNRLQQLLSKLQPDNIHVCFQVKESAYMNVFPAKEDFKSYYKLLLKQRRLDKNQDYPLISDAKGWSKGLIQFMTDVFTDLHFVNAYNDIIEVNPQPISQDLSESITYQNRLNKAEIEKTLYYSTYEELTSWLTTCIEDRKSSEEEIIYGL